MLSDLTGSLSARYAVSNCRLTLVEYRQPHHLYYWSSTIAQETYPLTKDGYLQAVEFDDAKANKLWTRRKVGATCMFLALATSLGASNTDEFERFGYLGQEGSWATTFDDCYIEPVAAPSPDVELTDKEKQDFAAKQQIEAEYADVTSAAYGVDIWEYLLKFAMSLTQFAEQSVEYTFAPETRFTMEQSGIEVVIYAPENVEIDEEAFSELFHASLNVDPDKFKHQEVKQLMSCYRQAAIDEKRFAGEVYRVYVAPDKGYCIKNGSFQLAAEVESCDGAGFTPPLVDVDFLGLTLAEYRIMMLSTPKTGDDASKDINRRLIHEGSNHAMASLIDKRPFMLNPDEQLHRYIEDITIEELYPDGLPEAIKYK